MSSPLRKAQSPHRPHYAPTSICSASRSMPRRKQTVENLGEASMVTGGFASFCLDRAGVLQRNTLRRSTYRLLIELVLFVPRRNVFIVRVRLCRKRRWCGCRGRWVYVLVTLLWQGPRCVLAPGRQPVARKLQSIPFSSKWPE